MAKSLDDLIEYLLQEIATGGSRGITINQLDSLVHTFYEGVSPQSNTGDANSVRVQDQSRVSDPRFLAKIWTWLGRHPDVSLGENKKYNKKNLDEVGLPVTNLALSISSSKNEESQRRSPVSHAQGQPEDEVRITVSSERVYQAICGHPHDTSRISNLEFDLLSHIAAAGVNGILQGELRQATGQDKRSVPKRTDALHAKGYIVKEPVYVKGNRTSRLTLKRLANLANAKPVQTKIVTKRETVVGDVVRRVFDVLSHQGLCQQTDLAEEMDMASTSKSAVLSKIVRRLEKLKHLKRVRTAFGPSSSVGDLKQCIQLLHRPKDGIPEGFDTEDINLEQPIEQLAAMVASDNVSSNIVDTTNYASLAREDDINAVDSHDQSREDFEEEPEELESVSQLALWNPDRQISHSILDALRSTPSESLSNLTARALITGFFVRKAMESTLIRLASNSLTVQPSHLKHLSVIRASTTVNGFVVWSYYSWNTFCRLLEENQLNVNDIPGAKDVIQISKSGDKGTKNKVSLKNPVVLDEFGFPSRKAPTSQIRGGEADFESLLKAAGIGDIPRRKGEPVIVLENGKKVLKISEDGVTGAASTRLDDSVRPESRMKLGRPPKDFTPTSPHPKTHSLTPQGEGEVVKGRPRKYARGTEKFWKVILTQFRMQDKTDTPLKKGGATHDPSAMAFHARRPTGFDQTLVSALNAGLPAPACPEDITDDWVAGTRKVLERAENGLFITPAGSKLGQGKYNSQILILKSDKLKFVDFTERTEVYPFRFLSSSAAHSLPFFRYYPGQDTRRRYASAKSSSRRAKLKVSSSRIASDTFPGPNIGLFDDPLPSSVDPLAIPPTVLESTGPVEGYHGSTEIDPEVMKLATPPERRSSLGPAVSTDSAVQIPSSETDANECLENNDPRGRKADFKSTNEFVQIRSFPSTAGQLVSPLQVSDEGAEIHDEQHGKQSPKSVRHVEEPPPHPSSLKPGTNTSDIVIEIRSTTGDQARGAGTTPQGEPNGIEQEMMLTGGVDNPQSEDPTSDTQLSVPAAKSYVRAVDKSGASPRRPTARKRDREAYSSSEDDYAEDERPKRCKKQGPNAIYNSALCRTLVEQLVVDSPTGVVPGDAHTIRRVISPRWQEAGETDRPDLKNVKLSIKSLCASGKLKQTTFTFRNKSGASIKRSILFAPTILADSPVAAELRQRIIDADPTDVIPEDWQKEATRAPLIGPKASIVRAEHTTAARGRNRERKSSIAITSPIHRRRASDSVSVDSTDSTTARNTRRSARQQTQSPPPPVTATTGFLTLKVGPRLAGLAAVQLYNWRAQFPVNAQRMPQAAFAVDSVRQRTRSARQSHNRIGRTPVTWAGASSGGFPTCLQDVIDESRPKLVTDFEYDDPNWQRFAREIDIVATWEEESAESLGKERSRSVFINHSIPEAFFVDAVVPPAIQFSSLVGYGEQGNEVDIPFPSIESWPPFVLALEEARKPCPTAGDDVAQASPVARINSSRRSKRKRNDDDFIDEAVSPILGSRRRTLQEADGSVSESSTPASRRRVRKPARPRRKDLDSPGQAPNKYARGTQYLRLLPDSEIYRIIVSVVVVQTLAGGIQRHILWPLVKCCFPKETEEFIRGRYETLYKKHRVEIRGLTESLQHRYLEALGHGTVPSVDYDDLPNTDWKGIVDWAVEHLDRFNTRTMDDLPSSREALLSSSVLVFNEPKRWASILSYSYNATNPIKEDIVTAMPFAIPLSTSSPLVPASTFPVLMRDRPFRLARSYILSLLLTRQSQATSDVGRQKLESIHPDGAEVEATVLRVLKSLQAEHIIQRTLDSRNIMDSSSLRTWEIHRKYTERFEERRMINATMLRAAFTYKHEVLDAAFAQNAEVVLEKWGVMADGDVLAILNLCAMGWLHARRGDDAPVSRYGVDWRNTGYQSRGMDKRCLGFSVYLSATEKYTPGDVMGDRRANAVPRGDTDVGGEIPPWIDIQGNLQPRLWEMFVAGVLGLAAQLAGVKAEEVSRTLAYGLSEAEVDLVVDWLVGAGFARRTRAGHGVETTEHWWGCIADGGFSWH